VADWQAALRRQFGREQRFGLRNLGSEPVFSTFRVDNPDGGMHYHVTVHGNSPGQNTCSCWDYATDHLGTWKHIEFTLARLQARRCGKAVLARGFTPPNRLEELISIVQFVAGAMGTDEGDEPTTAPAATAPTPPAEMVSAVEEAAASMLATPVPGIAPAADGSVAAAPVPEAAPAEADRPPPAADPWADLLQVGAAMLQGLAAQRGQGGASPVRIERDPVTGQPSLRLPLPDPALLQRLAQALSPWLRP